MTLPKPGITTGALHSRKTATQDEKTDQLEQRPKTTPEERTNKTQH